METDTRKLLDALAGRLLDGWNVQEEPRRTADALYCSLTWPFREIVAGYVSKEPQAAIRRLAMISAEIREIIDDDGESWLKSVFGKMAIKGLP